ncbi:MAG: glycosyltransferase family 2 protein [Flavobacteriales bacterium]|nr:glycosyltransferase family 2 protein [Flavobacteriales bacterium]
MALFSIIIPVYNSEELVAKTVHAILDEMEHHRFEIEMILVNDGSPDGSWEVISQLARQFSNVRSINLLHNFGQHTAVLCGIAHAKGEYLVTMDDDLQNPPSELPKLFAKIAEGYDLVFARFDQKKHAGYRKLGSKIIGYLNKKVFDKPDDIVLTNFRIFTKETAQRVLQYRTNYPYIPGMLLMSAGRIANVTTSHHSRERGTSNYSIWKILQLVSRLLFNYSSYPLRLVSTMGLVISAVSFLGGLGYMAKSFFLGVSVAGWTTIVVLISFLIGFVLIILGIMGEYLARIMNQLATDKPYQIRDIVE